MGQQHYIEGMQADPVSVSVQTTALNTTSDISNREELQFPALPLKVVHCDMLIGDSTDVR